MTRSYLPSIPLTERTNGEKICWLRQWLLCLSLLIFSHQASSAAIGSNLWVSALELPMLIPMMTSFYWSHNSQIITSPVYPIFHSPDGCPSLICYISGGWGVWLIHMLRWRLVDQGIGVCHALCWDVWYQGPPFIELSVWRTYKDVAQISHLIWRLGGNIMMRA